MPEITQINVGGSVYDLNAARIDPGASIDGVLFTGGADVIHYGVSNTASATAAKTVSIADFDLMAGARVAVKFTNADTSGAPFLNVSGTGAKAIKADGTWAAGDVVEFVYDGENWSASGGFLGVVPGAVEGDIPVFAADGSLEDSGIASGSVAQQDGYYSGMTVGAAETLIGRGDGVVVSYTAQSAGGDADIEDGTATIQTVRGNTVYFNQLVNNGNFTDATGWSGFRCSVAVASNVLTATVTETGGRVDLYLASTGFGHTLGQNITAGHKYYAAASVKAPAADTMRIMLSQTQTANAGTPVTATPDEWTRMQCVITADTDIASNSGALTLRLGTYGLYAVNDEIQVQNVIVVDLTRMFGQGKEPLTPADFAALYPLDWYTASTGTALNFLGTGITTVGYNAYDLTNRIARVVAANDENNGYRISGTYTTSGVTFSTTENGTFTALPVEGYTDNSGNTIQRIQPPTNGFVKIAGADSTTCLNLIWSGYRDTDDAEEYWSATKTLPVSTYFHDGMKSAGSARDEMNLNTATQRIGSVDMGTLTWSKVTNYANPLFYADVTGKAEGTDNVRVMDLQTTGKTLSAMPPMTIRGASSRAVRVIVRWSDDSISAEDFTTAVTGMTLFYEMDTPVTTTISPVLDLSIQVSDFGIEVLNPENSATPTTSPCNLVMLYGVNVQDAIRRLPQNYIGKKSWDSIAAALSEIGIDIALTYDADGAAYIASLTDNRDNRLVDVPASATAAGTAGTYAVDPTGGYLYVCMTTGEDGSAAWMRVQMSAWT